MRRPTKIFRMQRSTHISFKFNGRRKSFEHFKTFKNSCYRSFYSVLIIFQKFTRKSRTVYDTGSDVHADGSTPVGLRAVGHGHGLWSELHSSYYGRRINDAVSSRLWCCSSETLASLLSSSVRTFRYHSITNQNTFRKWLLHSTFIWKNQSSIFFIRKIL